MSWVKSVAGKGYGHSAGVIGTFLQRAKRGQKRLESMDGDEDNEQGVEQPFEAGPEGDPERSLLARETSRHLTTKLNGLDDKRRFALSVFILVRTGYVQTKADVIREIEALISALWPMDCEQRLNAARTHYGPQEAADLTDSFVKETVGAVVGVGRRQLARWLDSFFGGLRDELGGSPA